MESVGINKEDKQDRARARYLQALKPIRQPLNWDTWLKEYNHVAIEAETNKVSEVQCIYNVIKDLLVVIINPAAIQGTSCQESGRQEADINRKEVIKRF